MIFTKKIFENKIDESIHSNFTRFSKGTFENRALMKITIAKDKFKLESSYDLVKDITLSISNFDNIEVIGKIINKKSKEEIEKTVSGEELRKICEENPFVLLNLKFGEHYMKVGKTIPKPGSDLKRNFCKCLLPLSMLNEFIDKENFKKAEISHTFIIEKITIPKDCGDNFELARLKAKRKGKIIKKEIIDKKEETKEIEFEV